MIVATVRALKYHGGVEKDALGAENLEALEKGLPNLLRHADNIKNVFGLPCVVAVNVFPTDAEAELALVAEKCAALGVKAVRSDVWARGGAGGEALAAEVVRLCEEKNEFRFAYDLDGTIEERLDALCRNVYRADGAVLTPEAKKQAARAHGARLWGAAGMRCQNAVQLFGRTRQNAVRREGFTVTVREIRVSAGAGFLVALTGNIMTMPGLPKSPAAERIDVDENGVITGMF